MTFNELFAEHNLTPAERDALVAYLASLRMLGTLRALAPPPPQVFGGMRNVPLGGEPNAQASETKFYGDGGYTSPR